MNNSFDCTWKLLTSTCLDGDLIVDKNEIIINHSLMNQCPRYNVSKNGIFIANDDAFILGEKNRVIIQTIGLKFRIQRYFRCVLTFMNGSIITTIGKIYNDLLICQPFQVKIEVLMNFKKGIEYVLDFL
jgi:hypothetical protein